mmetsp:Transcript_21519/g.45282  ORF Transcript_21519/g.45282 Transcript_21519/m.45282 type:complete len:202 (-) Transcript_21519:304-909(-)
MKFRNFFGSDVPGTLRLGHANGGQIIGSIAIAIVSSINSTSEKKIPNGPVDSWIVHEFQNGWISPIGKWKRSYWIMLVLVLVLVIVVVVIFVVVLGIVPFGLIDTEFVCCRRRRRRCCCCCCCLWRRFDFWLQDARNFSVDIFRVQKVGKGSILYAIVAPFRIGPKLAIIVPIVFVLVFVSGCTCSCTCTRRMAIAFSEWQ